MIHIDIAQFKAHLQIAPKSDLRHYLNSLCFEICANGDALLVSTDGVMLLVTKLPPLFTGDAFETPQCIKIPREAVERAILNVKGELCLTPTHLGNVQFEQAEGSYPDWRRIIPKQENESAGLNYNPLLLAKMKKAFMYLKAGETQMFGVKGHHGMAVFTAKDTDAIGIVMSLRANPVWRMPFVVPTFN